jgi:S-adenosylhomocysteine hydrolase
MVMLRIPPRPPRAPTTPRSPPPPLKLVDIVERLQTAEGQRVLSGVVDHAAAAAGLGDEALGPGERVPQKPADLFDAAVVDGWADRFTRVSDRREEATAVLTETFAAFADANGVIDVAKACKALGPQAMGFLTRLQGIGESKSTDPLADRRGFDILGDQLTKKVVGGESIAPPMAALEVMVKQIAKTDEFKGFQFLGLQHLFASTATLFGALNQTGIKTADMRVIGKIYSTNHRVVADLTTKGATVDGVSRKVGAREFGAAMNEGIEHQLRSIINTLPQPNIFTSEGRQFTEKPTPRVLLIDDGAEAIKVLHEKFPEFAPFFVCVEQTRRGARILHELEAKGELKCVVANVAESWAKLELESPMIGHSVVLEVSRKLDRLAQQGVPVSKETLVLGCGAVGGGVAEAMLRRGQDVHLYDKDATRSAQLKERLVSEGFDASRIFVHDKKGDALAHGGVVVSCVGVRTIDREDHASLPNGAILVNAASADDELGPQDLLCFGKRMAVEKDERGNIWNVFGGKPINCGKSDAEAHSDAVVKLPSGKELLVINNGYVVNMTGERDPIPPRYIQLTRTLLFLGAVAARRAADAPATKPGIIEVPKDWQEALVHLVQRDLKKTGEDLKSPSWDKKQPHAPEEVLTPPVDVVKAANDELAATPVPVPPVPPKADSTKQKGLAGEVAAILKFAGAPPTNKLVPIDPQGRIYGHQLGETAAGSRERIVANLVENKTSLSVEGAALYQATAVINKQLNISLRTSLTPEMKFVVDQARVQHLDGRAVRVADDEHTPLQRFESSFGHFARVLLTSVLGSRLQREPTAAELAKELVPLFRSQSVDVTLWLTQLGRSSAPDDLALWQAMKAA